MHTIRKFSVLAGLALALGAAAPMATAPSPSPLGDLAWLAGTWLQEDDTGLLMEETWSAPRADAMVGMFRLAQRGKVSLFELMSIELDGPAGSADGPLIPGQEPVAGGAPQRLVFRLRHFHRGLAPWEAEQDGPLTFSVLRLQPNEVVFEDPTRQFPNRVLYRRDGDVLTIRIISATPAQEDLEYKLKRVGA